MITDWLLRVAGRALPASRRPSDGPVVHDCARDMIDDGHSSIIREAGGLIWLGLAWRTNAAWSEVRGGPWRGAAAAIALPLGLLGVAIWIAAAPQPVGGGWPGLWWMALLGGLVSAVAAIALGHQRTALAGSLVALVPVAHDLWVQAGAGPGARVDLPLADGWLPLSGAWALPGVLLVVAARLTPRRDLRRASARVTVVVTVVVLATIGGPAISAAALGATVVTLSVGATAGGVLVARAAPTHLGGASRCGVLVAAAGLPVSAWAGAVAWSAHFDHGLGPIGLAGAVGAVLLGLVGLARRGGNLSN